MQKHTRLQDIDPLSIATRGSTLTRIILSSACFLVAACGGGGGGSETSGVATLTTLRQFSDGAGVGRIVLNSDGSQGIFITPEITQVVAAGNQVTTSDLLGGEYSDFPITATTPTANIREGTFTNHGITSNIYYVEDLEGEAAVALVTFPSEGERFVLVGGNVYGGVPSGEFTYQGTQGIALRAEHIAPELGTFSLTANFDERTFAYDGISTNSDVSGSGVIDTVNGRFATNALDITAYGTDYTGSMNGLLHGSSSESVSGVFHTNDNNPDYAGAFVGSR